MSAPEDRTSTAFSLGGALVLSFLLGIVPVLGAFCLLGLGLAAMTTGRRREQSALSYQDHGEALSDGAAVAVGQVVTLQGRVSASELVQPTLFTKPVALSVCKGYRQMGNVGSRSLLFTEVRGGPVELRCGSRSVRLQSTEVDLLSEPVKGITSNVAQEPRFATWFGKWADEEGDQDPSTFEFEESVVEPRATLTATGMVSAIERPEQDEAREGAEAPAERVTLTAPRGRALELTTLSSEEIATRAADGQTEALSGLLMLAAGAVSGFAWWNLAIHYGWVK